MEHPSCPPVHPVRAGDVDDYNAFAWRERHPVEDRVSGQRLALISKIFEKTKIPEED